MKKLLEKKMSQVQRRNGQLMAQVGAMRKEVQETREGMKELILAQNTVLANVAVALGKEKLDDESGEPIGWKLDIPNIPLEEIAQKYEFRACRDPKTGYTVVVVISREPPKGSEHRT